MRWMPKKARVLVAVASAGVMFQTLSGCDPGVRDTVLGGVESASTGLAATFIQAFFQTLQDDSEDGGETPT
jgi:hypothetical protein